MSSNRVVRVRPARRPSRSRASPQRAARRDRARSRASSRSARRSRRRSRRPPRRRPRTRGCPTSTAPTSRSSRSTRPAPMDLDQALHLARDGDGVRRPLRDRRRRGVRHARRPGRRGGAPARPDALRRRQPRSRCTRRSISEDAGVAAARPGAAGAAVDDPAGRDRRGHRRRGRAGAGAVDRAQLTTRSAQQLDRRRLRRRVADAAQGGRRAPARPRGGPRRRLAAAARAGGRHRRRPWALEFRDAAAGRGVERADLVAHRLRRGLADGLRPGRPAPHAAAAGPARRPAAAPHRAGARHRVAGRAALPRLHPRPRPGQARSTRR